MDSKKKFLSLFVVLAVLIYVLPAAIAIPTGGNNTIIKFACCENATNCTCENATNCSTFENATICTCENATNCSTFENVTICTCENATNCSTFENATICTCENATICTCENATNSTCENATNSTCENATICTCENATNCTCENATICTCENATCYDLIANFTANITFGYSPLTVNFNDTSQGQPNEWYWDFGDGGNSTEQNPLHTYSHSGSYDVTLTSTNDMGNNTITKYDYISVGNPQNVQEINDSRVKEVKNSSGIKKVSEYLPQSAKTLIESVNLCTKRVSESVYQSAEKLKLNELVNQSEEEVIESVNQL